MRAVVEGRIQYRDTETQRSRGEEARADETGDLGTALLRAHRYKIL